ncbi:MAG: CvpA family protein [Candidatus Margulisiibacteriota bacterium]
MINSHLIDAILIGYVLYSVFIGFKRGVFNVILSIFGTYGACFLAWVFRDSAYQFLTTYIGLEQGIYPSLFFLMLWFGFYTITYLVAKIITGLFKLSGINFVIRIIGGGLNGIKAVLIAIVVLTFISSLNVNVYEDTDLTKKCVNIGSKALKLFKRNIDENQIDLEKLPEINKDAYIMDDDFRYNLLER